MLQVTKINCFLFVCLIFYVKNAYQAKGRQKYFQIGDAYACPDSETMPSYFNGSALKEQQINKISFYGYINVTEDIPGPWEFVMDVTRCKLDMKFCDETHKVVIPKMCGKIQDTNATWASFFDGFSPRINCPIKKGVYIANNATLDVSFLVNFALENYRWMCHSKIIRIGKNNERISAFCVDYNVAITIAKIKRN